jgi:hypothetical protein
MWWKTKWCLGIKARRSTWQKGTGT